MKMCEDRTNEVIVEHHYHAVIRDTLITICNLTLGRNHTNMAIMTKSLNQVRLLNVKLG